MMQRCLLHLHLISLVLREGGAGAKLAGRRDRGVWEHRCVDCRAQRDASASALPVPFGFAAGSAGSAGSAGRAAGAGAADVGAGAAAGAVGAVGAAASTRRFSTKAAARPAALLRPAPLLVLIGLAIYGRANGRSKSFRLPLQSPVSHPAQPSTRQVQSLCTFPQRTADCRLRD